MYHDQGHGPVKVLAIESGVNIMIGLPIIRTSIDHSTAFDIAGTGKADQRSLLVAIEQAIRIRLAPGSWILDSDLFSPEDNGLSRDKKRCQITTWLAHLTANLDLY
jgi:hypothetical protein